MASTTAQCGSFPLTTSTDCSGNGVCSTTASNVCICKEGWSGLSDWVNAHELDCQMNKYIFLILWIAVLSVYSLAVLWGVPRIYASYKLIMERRKQMTGSKKVTASRLRQNGTFLMCAIHICVTTPAAFVLGMLEITTNQRVGVDWAPTILYLIWRSAFFICSAVFQPYMLSTIVGSIGKDARDAVRDFSRKSIVLNTFTLVIGFVVLGSMLARTPSSQVATYVSYCMLVTVSQFGFFFQARFTRNKIITILQKSYAISKSDEILEVQKKLTKVQGTVMAQTAMMGTAHFLIGAIPYMWNKFSYFIPVSIVLTGILFVNVVRTLGQDSKKKTIDAAESSHNLSNNAPARPTLRAANNVTSSSDLKVKRGVTVELNLQEEVHPSTSNTIAASDSGAVNSNQVPLDLVVPSHESSMAGLEATPVDDAEYGQTSIEHKTFLVSPSRLMTKMKQMATPSSKKSSEGKSGAFDDTPKNSQEKKNEEQ